MFYDGNMLARRGPLAKVWLAAHWERKLSKTQTLQTDINQSVGAIIGDEGDEVEILALRTSGQLLLGVVRIYSRKAKYLLDDCNEALVKIKLAFRPGAVDMTEEQMIVPKGAITLQDGGIDLDLLLPDANWDLDFTDRPHAQGQNLARAADITLQTGDDLDFDFERPRYGFDLGMGEGIEDFDDLGLDFDGPGNDPDMSIELGRRASTADHHSVVGSHILGDGARDLDVLSRLSREPSEHGGDIPMDLGGDFDLGGGDFDLGIGFDGDAETPGLAAVSPSRASSPLTPAPQTPGAEPANELAEDAQATPKASPTKRKPATKKLVEKKQVIDDVTELEGGPKGRGRAGGDLGPAVNKDVSSILAEPRYLPSSRTVARLHEIRHDPLAHFMPIKDTADGRFFFAGPPGLAPELLELFMFPANNATTKRRAVSPDGDARSPKKRRVEQAAEDEDDVELGRRDGSRAPSIAMGSDILGGADPGPGLDMGDGGDLGLGDFDMPAYDDEPVLALHDETRLSTPGADGEVPDVEDGEAYVDLSCPIALFDSSQATQEQRAAEEAAAADSKNKGYSKNTTRALQILRRELAPVDGVPREEPVSFVKMSEKATRRAAASFFFELLVLGTRDSVKLSQDKAFANIEVRAKDRLWERQTRGRREASAAPSMVESMVSGL